MEKHHEWHARTRQSTWKWAADAKERSALPDDDRRAQAFAQPEQDATQHLIRDHSTSALLQLAVLGAPITE
jgi:hypothetical protein